MPANRRTPGPSAVAALLGLLAAPVWAASVEPVLVPGQNTCDDLISDYTCVFKGGGPYGPSTQMVTCGDTVGTIQILNVGFDKTFDFILTGLVANAVTVKGGPDTNLSDYRPTGTDADTDLHAPVNPNNGRFYGLSNFSLCLEPVPTVGALRIQKFTKFAGLGPQALPDVPFDFVGADGTVFVQATTQANGEVCVQGLPVGASPITIKEVVPPDFAQTEPDPVVDIVPGTTCEANGGATEVQIVNTPLSTLEVNFISQVPDATIASIQCRDMWGMLITPDPSDPTPEPGTLDDTLESYPDLLPGTYDCKITIDP